MAQAQAQVQAWVASQVTRVALSGALLSTIAPFALSHTSTPPATGIRVDVSAGRESEQCNIRGAHGWQKAFNGMVTPDSGKRGWVAGDGYYSTQVTPAGAVSPVTVFLFGDTIMGDTVVHRGKEATGNVAMVRNSMVVYNPRGATPSDCLTSFPSPSGKPVLSTGQSTKSWWWPSSTASSREGGGKLWVFATKWFFEGKVSGKPDDVYRSQFRGNGVFPVSVSDRGGNMVVESGEGKLFRPLPGHKNIMWGASVWEDETSGYVYIFGTESSTEPYVFGKNVYVARIPASAVDSVVANPREWEYATGGGWETYRPSLQLARVVNASDGFGTSTGFSVLRNRQGNPTIVTKANEFLGDKVVSVSGFAEWLVQPSGTPPLLSAKTLFVSPSSEDGDTLTYLPFAHPGLGGRKLLVTVNRNTLTPGKLQRDVRTYQAKWYTMPNRW